MNLKTTNERLYLFRGENQSEDVYIDSPILPQHQINALRFIYRQYKKKKSGIILNDPEGYGKTIEVVLFVKAIKHILKQPVLIICSEDDVDIWLQNFQKWAGFMEEIAVNPDNPNIKGKKVLIATWNNFIRFHGKNWNIMVVHHDKPKKELFKYRFDANFKIWVSSEDMVKNLDSFVTIYEWLNPHADIDLLRHNGSELEREIHIDAFMQDIVIRGRGFDSPEIRTKKIDSSPTQIQKNSRKTKNKDPTGTKTKRSRKIVDSIPSDTIKLERVNLDENNDLPKPEEDRDYLSNSKIQKANEMSEKKSPSKRIKLGQSKATYTHNKEHTSLDCTTVSKIKNEIDAIDDMSIENGNIHPVTSDILSNKISNHVNNDDINIDVKVEDIESNSSQNITLHYPERDSNCLEDNIKMEVDLETESPSLLTFNTNATKVTGCVQNDNDKKDIEGDKFDDIINLDKDLTYNGNDENNESSEVSDKYVDNYRSDWIINSAENVIPVPNGDKNNIGPNEASMCSKASKSTIANKNLVNKSFESKMNEMEQKVLNKFKDSLLDSIF